VQSSSQSRIACQLAVMSVVVACSPTLLLGSASETTLVLHVSAELRASHTGTLPDAEFEVAGRTARTLLATAGIAVDLRDCRAAVSGCGESAPGQVVISVRLRPARKTTDVTACGEVVRDYLGRPVVVVYLPPHAELATAFRFHVASRSNPALGEIRTGHLVGLTLAHEVGHWLGLPHAASGVMKARPAFEEVTALVSQRLAFESQQGSGLRHALLQRSLAVLAANR
jgi:hypothetical protein